MNKIFSLFVLVPTVFCGINNFSTKAQIPQGSFQQIYIEGYANQVTQQLNQNLNLHFVDVPEIELSVIPNVNIQGAFFDNPNNEVEQAINQNVFDFDLMPLALTDLSVNDFIGDDNILNGVQFNEQQVFLQGYDNLTSQRSVQSLTDFYLLESSEFVTESNSFDQFLIELLESQPLDSFQFSSQDTWVFGNNNIVAQSITQTFDIFILFDSDSNSLFNSDNWMEDKSLNPIQFTIQETFIDESEDNYIIQEINQSIQNISLIEFDTVSQNNLLPSLIMTDLESNNLAEFPIDFFINEILNNTIIDSTQINSQFMEVIGNDNENIQENEQVLDLITNEESSESIINEQQLSVSIPEPSNLRMLLGISVIIGLRLCYLFVRSRLSIAVPKKRL